MANRLGRYRALYEKMLRPDNSCTIPRHVFLRSANVSGKTETGDRMANRMNCFEGTFVHLTERFNGKEVFLVGSANQSTMLAQRTQKLIQEVKPDAVMVQTNERWWNSAQLLQYVESQQEMNHYAPQLDRHTQFESFNYWHPTRAAVFWGRFYTMMGLFKYHFNIPFNFLRPGLEMKVACEEAVNTGAKLHFLGAELDQATWQRLYHETRMNLPQYIAKRFQYAGHCFWDMERWECTSRMHNSEPSQFTEQCLDPYQINWFIQNTDIFFPKLKSIIIDKRDQDLFQQIDKCDGDRIVVVVNQWHMEGIEHEWAHSYGQLPRSVHFQDISPIGDMNLRDGLFQRLYNVLHREINSANSKGAPSTYSDWIIGYHRESNWQYEHRDM